jgi:hypothetical protein
VNLRKDHYHTIQTLHPREMAAGMGCRHTGLLFLLPPLTKSNKNQVPWQANRLWLVGLPWCRPLLNETETESKLSLGPPSWGFLWLYNSLQLSAMDVLDPTTMKNAAKCNM